MLLYFLTVLGFGLFFVCAGTATLTVALYPPARYQLPVMWRVWVWGTAGFACGYFAFHFALRLLPAAARDLVGRLPNDHEAGLMLSSMLYIPPVLAIIGGIAGAVFGYFSGKRRLETERQTDV